MFKIYVTSGHLCEQLAQGQYVVASWPLGRFIYAVAGDSRMV